MNKWIVNSPNIATEMHTLQAQVQAAVDSKFPSEELKISTLEVGLNTIQKWYDNLTRRISIEDDFRVVCDRGLEIETEDWRAFVTAVSGKWLRELYLDKGEDLFSGNPRSYLGRGKRRSTINSGIIESAQNEPGNFWAYNNGVTALVNDFYYGNGELEIKEITIINGAQTTGAISAPEQVKKDFYIPCRFIVRSNKSVIEAIIDNNKQNEILPSDLRSNDRQQERLRNEFKNFPSLYYNGGRRDDKIVKNKVIFVPYLVDQTILAYHGDCVTAYNRKKRIWDEDKLYTQVFVEQLSVEHIIFVYSLVKAIYKFKNELKNKKEQRIKTENKQFDFLLKRGSKMLLITTISECLEDLIVAKITDKWQLHFKNNSDFASLMINWEKIISPIISFSGQLILALQGGLKNKQVTNTCVQNVKNIVSSLKEMYIKQLKTIIDEI